MPTAGIEPARLKQARDFKAVGKQPKSKAYKQNAKKKGHGFPPVSGGRAKRKSDIGEVRVVRRSDGYAVIALRPPEPTYTIATGLEHDHAIGRAEAEAAERRIPFRR